MENHGFFLESDISQKSRNYFTNDADFQTKKTRAIRDAQAHRMIEKRRRDRMNSCLTDLGQLIQASNPEYRQGRIEKTEIIEMAIEHINFLQSQVSARQNGEEDRFVTGFKSCRDEVVKYWMSKSGNDSMDSEGMNLVAHLQDNLQTLCSGANGSTIVTSTQHSNRFLHKSATISSADDIKQEIIESFDTGPFFRPVKPPGECLSKSDRNAIDSEKLSLSSSSSSSSDINKQDPTTDWASFTEGRSAQKDSHKRRDGPGDVRNGRRRSFSECSVPYKFKENMKVRFRNDSINGDTETLRSEHDGNNSRKRMRSECDNRNEKYDGASTSSTRVREFIRPSVPATAATLSISSLVDEEDYVPAFALYPGCSFYIPVSLSNNQIAHVLDTYSPRDRCHPISISVNFSGPRIAGTVSDGAGLVHERVHKFTESF